MKKLLLIFAMIAISNSTSSAQALRLGEPIPDIDVVSMMGPKLKRIKSDYVCLIFAHPDSKHCIDALNKFQEADNAMRGQVSVVIITYTKRDYDNPLLAFVDRNTTLAFDNRRHTFRNFGIDYVPFSVIYCHKHRETLWFGTLASLDKATLEQVINNHKHL